MKLLKWFTRSKLTSTDFTVNIKWNVYLMYEFICTLIGILCLWVIKLTSELNCQTYQLQTSTRSSIEIIW